MAGAASALFLLDIKGRVLVWRDYRGDVTAAQAERFFSKLIEKEVFTPRLLSPIFDLSSTNYKIIVILSVMMSLFIVHRLEFDQ